MNKCKIVIGIVPGDDGKVPSPGELLELLCETIDKVCVVSGIDPEKVFQAAIDGIRAHEAMQGTDLPQVSFPSKGGDA